MGKPIGENDLIVQSKDINGKIIKSDTLHPKIIASRETKTKIVPTKTTILKPTIIERYIDGKRQSVWDKK